MINARRVAASAPGKLILCGEHAVVYNQPAIAIPLSGVRAHATIEAAPSASGVQFDAPDLERSWNLVAEPDDPLCVLLHRLLERIPGGPALDARITITSDIPIASGMGSGAAVATALVRAAAHYLGHALTPADVSALVYESERRLHGTPSGIDNTVVAFEQPIWFVRGTTAPGSDPSPRIEAIVIGAPLELLVGDTGVRSATRLPVGEVRRRWQAEPTHYEALFSAVGALVAQARVALARGDTARLGALLNENHILLQQIGVSSPLLDRLVWAAQEAGALGAKLSGAGWGGVMLALVTPATRAQVAAALQQAGAVRVLATSIQEQVVLHTSVR